MVRECPAGLVPVECRSSADFTDLGFRGFGGVGFSGLGVQGTQNVMINLTATHIVMHSAVMEKQASCYIVASRLEVFN